MHNQQYTCLARQHQAFEQYSVVPLRPDDILAIKDWRNAQLEILRQDKPLTDEEQHHYYQHVVVPTYSQQHPEMVLFSFLHDNRLIGYGGLVHINWQARRAEVSFLVEPSRRKQPSTYQNDFHAFFTIIKTIAFDQLRLHRLTTETFSFRYRTIQLLEQQGFTREGRLRQHVYHEGGYVDSLVHGCLRPAIDCPQLNILVTSIGKKVPMLKAVRQAAERVALNSTLHGGDHDQTCLGRYHVDTFWPMKSDKTLTEQDVISYCEQHRITAIIPTRDAELPFFSRLAPALNGYGIRVMLGPEPGVAACIDKIAFYQKSLTGKESTVLQTVADIEQLRADHLVVKERYGSGSNNIGINLSRDEARLHAATLANPVFQPYLSGTEYSIDLYVDMQDICRGVVARTRDVVVQGESQVSTTVRHPQLEEQCRMLARHLELRGHLVFQAIEDEQGALHFFECNCRFGGASTLAVAAGLDSFFWFFSEGAGVDTSRIAWNRPPGELRLVRSTSDHFFEVG